MSSNIGRFASYLGAVGLSLAMTAPAYAAKDAIYPSAASATVSGVSADVTNTFVTGADGDTTLDEAVFEGQEVVVTATWSVKDNSGPGTNTNWTNPRSATFTTSTTQKPAGASDVSVAAISSCTLASPSATCTRMISFTAPATPGNYEVQVSVPNNNSPTANTGHLGRNLAVNFSVAKFATTVIEPRAFTGLRVALAAIVVYAQPYIANAGVLGVRDPGAVTRFSAHLASYITAPQENWLWGWTAFRFEGDESEIAIDPPPGGHAPEFDAWAWKPMEELPKLIVPFKRPLYEALVEEFGWLATA